MWHSCVHARCHIIHTIGASKLYLFRWRKRKKWEITCFLSANRRATNNIATAVPIRTRNPGITPTLEAWLHLTHDSVFPYVQDTTIAPVSQNYWKAIVQCKRKREGIQSDDSLTTVHTAVITCILHWNHIHVSNSLLVFTWSRAVAQTY